MLADLIRGFCNEPENNYEVFENYSGSTAFGKTTIGIVVKQGSSYLDMLMQLTSYLEAKGFDDSLLELEGTGIDELGPDMIVYFPAMQNYPPLQPQR